MLNVNELVGFGVGGRGQVTAEYISTVEDNTNKTTYTFAGRSLGAEGNQRKIAITVTGTGGAVDRTISSVSVAGVAGVQIVQEYINVSSLSRVSAIFLANVPTGTTGNVVVTGTGAFANCRIGVYAIRGLDEMKAIATNQSSSSSTTSRTLSLTSNEAGCAIACANYGSGTATWSGLTSNYDAAMGGDKATGASENFTTSGTKSITVTISSSGRLIGASAFF
jgi:hypothetical protein